jgi:hypothetical protein
MPSYGPPTSASDVPASVLDEWNAVIGQVLTQTLTDHPDAAPFLRSHPDLLPSPGPEDTAHWTGDPAEPRFCINQDWAEKLSDWGTRGRRELHNEYCEYVLKFAIDSNGRRRLKRVIATTELPEYWLTMAKVDPAFLKRNAEEILGTPVSYMDLYGLEDPLSQTPRDRWIAFANQTAGSCNNPELQAAGVPEYPIGNLNREHALFMIHPINGLDDLIYIVVFGAKPYAVNDGGVVRRANLHEIFRSQGVTHLACRNADPAAAAKAYDVTVQQIQAGVVRGKPIAFADPIGMFIQTFSSDFFTLDGGPVPDSWINLCRGIEGKYQHLEFGPPDEDPRFLDDAQVEDIAGMLRPVDSGYLVAKRIEVGPYIKAGAISDFNVELVSVPAEPASLDCSEAGVCGRIRQMKAAYEADNSINGLRQ